jgi:hypothetical protein
MILYKDEKLMIEAIPQSTTDLTSGYRVFVSSKGVGNGYGDYEYWFMVGKKSYKTLKTAAKYAQKALKDLGHEITIEF